MLEILTVWKIRDPNFKWHFKESVLKKISQILNLKKISQGFDLKKVSQGFDLRKISQGFDLKKIGAGSILHQLFLRPRDCDQPILAYLNLAETLQAVMNVFFG